MTADHAIAPSVPTPPPCTRLPVRLGRAGIAVLATCFVLLVLAALRRAGQRHRTAGTGAGRTGTSLAEMRS
jgi:hypothetical protein